jgi:hypothetical protein
MEGLFPEYTRPGFVMFIGVNPSTADEKDDDATIRRCVGFTRQWGYSRLIMTNLFGFCATDPSDMKAAEDPVGDRNDEFLLEHAKESTLIIAAWGIHGEYKGRDRQVYDLMKDHKLHHLGLTKEGHPCHPLYLPRTVAPLRFIMKPEGEENALS